MPKVKAWVFLAFVVILIALIGINDSRFAPDPGGRRMAIAHRGVHQLFDVSGLGQQDCTATRIFAPKHDVLENTTQSIKRAFANEADMVAIDIASTKDGRIVLFHDWGLDCRTNGKGDTRDATLAQLKALDIGYGYTADGGKTFPFRGKGVGLMPTLEEALAAAEYKPLLYNFKSNDPHEADMVAEILKKAGRDPIKFGDGFNGAQPVIDRVRQLFPGVLAFSKEEGKACTKSYMLYGWTSIIPENCQRKVLMVPLNYQWAIWGWPNRTQQRMDKVGAKIILLGRYDDGNTAGLDAIDQLSSVPQSFMGYVWVDKIEELGPSL